MWLAYVVVFFTFYSFGQNQTDKNNYGPYTLSWQRIETCKGPKQNSCGDFRVENTQNTSDIVFILDFTKDCPITSAKISLSSYQSKKIMNKMWNYVLNKPCQHFVLGPILLESFHITSDHCKIGKGRYQIHLNFLEKAKMFLGTKFFYGTYSFKVFAFNKINNIFCVDTIVDVNKKI